MGVVLGLLIHHGSVLGLTHNEGGFGSREKRLSEEALAWCWV